MTELEALALLIADLTAQVRALQAENAQLRETAAAPEFRPDQPHTRSGNPST